MQIDEGCTKRMNGGEGSYLWAHVSQGEKCRLGGRVGWRQMRVMTRIDADCMDEWMGDILIIIKAVKSHTHKKTDKKNKTVVVIVYIR